MLRNVITITLIDLSLGLASVAAAADKHGHDHKPRPGVLFAEAAGLDFELVAKADNLTLYVIEEGKPVETTDANGSINMGVGVRVAVAVPLAGKPEAKLNFRLK